MKPLNISVPTKYDVYLQSEDFSEIRKQIFKRDSYKCVVCGSTENLVPHHLTYKNIYHEDPRDLVTLCSKCHAIFHNIDNRRKSVDEFYSKRDAETLWAGREDDAAKLIYREITEEYLPKDYCKGGYLDMMSWEVLNPVIDKKCKEHSVNYYWGNKNKLRSYFLYRRCEFLLRCIDEGFSMQDVISKTNFDPQWISKWYRSDKCKAKLQEEKEIGGIQHETD